jgi:hypothetical protein
MNLKIKLIQFFIDVYRVRIHIHIFIEVSTYIYISISVFLKKKCQIVFVWKLGKKTSISLDWLASVRLKLVY